MFVTAIVAIAAVASSYRTGTPYVSDASVLISTGASTTVQVQQSMNTEKALASSRAVAASVVDRLHLHESLDAVLSGLSADVLLETQVLELTYSDARPERAKRLAQAFADAYVAYRGQLVDRVVASYATLDARIADLRDQLTRAQADVAGAADPSAATAARERVNTLSSQLVQLEQRRDGLFATAPVNAVVVESASTPKKVTRSTIRNLILGLGAGFVLGGLLAYALEVRAVKRRRTRADLALGRDVVWRR
jgi:uncharacterized protein involved in exopolysaccharide biosynthesis